MIDFTNKTIIKLKPTNPSEGQAAVGELLVNGEEIVFTFVSMRDKLVFTNKRIISINVQGLTGKKVDYSSIPYSKIQAFSIETAGTIDLDSELDVCISGLGKIRFELSGKSDIKGLGKHLANCIL